MPRDLIIIGSGPAGYTAALYAARANLAPLLFAGDPGMQTPAGGQLMITTEVENYPGFPEGITGPELMDRVRRQAERFGTEVRYETVTRVDFSRRPFRCRVGETEHQARAVIVATGANARWLDLPADAQFRNAGLSACATCDGAFFKDVEVGVVGGGDSAMEESLFLTRYATRVHVLHRRAQFRASKIMAERVLAHPKISAHWNKVVVDYVGGPHPVVKSKQVLAGAVLEDTVTGVRSTLPLGGLFIAVGHQPNSALFADYLDTDELGYLKIQPGSQRTKVEGVFAAGDIHDRRYRQAVTAAGAGCAAAIEAERWLEAQAH